MKILILSILSFLFGQTPIDLDLAKVRTAFITACKPQLEPWVEMGSHIGAGAHIFHTHPMTADYPAKSAAFNIGLFSVDSKPEQEEVNCLLGYTEKAYGPKIGQWVQAQTRKLVEVKSGKVAMLDRGILYILEKGLGRYQRPGGCGRLEFSVYQF